MVKVDQKDGRTVCIFENGTESNMIFNLLQESSTNGKVVTQNV